MAFIGLGIAEGAKEVGDYMRNRDLRQAQLAEAKARAQHAELSLSQARDMAPAQKSQAELLAYNTSKQLLQNQTYDALQRYDADKDARHLNLFLEQAKTNPMGAKLYGNITRFDTLASAGRSQEVDQLLRQAGYADPEDAFKEANSNMVLATDAAGKYALLDLDTFKRATGYNKYATNEQLAQQEQQARINQMLRSGMRMDKVEQLESIVKKLKQENPKLSTTEAYKQANDLVNRSGGSSDERIIQQLVDQGMSIEQAIDRYYGAKRQGTGQTNEGKFISQYMEENPGSSYVDAAAAYANRSQTTTQKEIGDIEQVKQTLKDSGFFDKDLSKLTPQERADVHESIARIEDLRGVTLSTEDKRLARQFRDLISLGTTAGEQITDQETGLIDSMLNKVKSYVSNEVGGKEATSAYESFRNIFRNALYGASLTNSEISAFNAAMGTLGQQTKPVLSQLRTQMQSIKTQLEAIRDTNDPYLAKYYFGSSIDDIDKSIEGIEQRLDFLTTTPVNRELRVRKPGVNPVSSVEVPSSGVQPGSERPSLDSIFGGGN